MAARNSSRGAARGQASAASTGQPGTAGGKVLPPGSGQIVAPLVINPDPGTDAPADTGGPAPIRRQAIVVVHGQGQQRPMGTVRDFVDRLWRFNPDLEDEAPAGGKAASSKGKTQTKTTTGEEGKGRDYWIVPDGKTGLFELQRVTTPAYHGRRTDFFELYYADLLDNTPIRNLWRWLQRLLFIDKNDIPFRMRRVWHVLRWVSLAAAALVVWVVFSLPDILHANWVSAFVTVGDDNKWTVNPAGWIGLVVLAAGLAYQRYGKDLAARWEWARRLPFWLPFAIGLLGLALVLSASPPFFGAVLLGLGGYFATNEVLPLFGDAASYLSAQTETVESRQKVRDRGLTLLRALHDDPDYDRVVIVAHSLGTVVAYDLLHLLWQAVGPTKQNPPRGAALAALRGVDALLAKKGDWSAGKLDTYQAQQWAAFDELRQQRATAATPAVEATDTTPAVPAYPAYPAGWKVSDLVTLGSPLGNATFLVTNGTKEFARLKEERLMPTSPPRPYDISKSPTSFFDEETKSAHHAAVFSVVRWTNIYDAHDPRNFLRGDFISASVKGDARFGQAMKDQRVTMTRADGSRFFSHNFYWQEKDGDGKPLASSEHVAIFRQAVGFDRAVPKPPKPSKAG